jgi:hypothetical protein
MDSGTFKFAMCVIGDSAGIVVWRTIADASASLGPAKCRPAFGRDVEQAHSELDLLVRAWQPCGDNGRTLALRP